MFDDEKCGEVYKSRGGVITPGDQVCAGGEKGRDSCVGDSGSALMRDTDAGMDFLSFALLSSYLISDSTMCLTKFEQGNLFSLARSQIEEIQSRSAAHLEDNWDRELRSQVLRHRGHSWRVHARPQLRPMDIGPRRLLRVSEEDTTQDFKCFNLP